MIKDKTQVAASGAAGGEAALPMPLRSWAEVLAPSAGLLAKYAVLFALGLLCSRGIVFGKYAPFGVAAVAAVPYAGMWSAVLGAAIGYLLPGTAAVPVHYIAAVLAAAAIRWTMSDLVRLRQHAVFAPLTAFLPVLCTGLALAIVNESSAQAAVMYVAEAFLAGGAAYFMARCEALVQAKREIASMNGQELACTMITCGVVLLTLGGLHIGGLSIGHILAVVAVLLAARYGGVAGGGIAGISAGVVFGLASTGLSYLSGAYALGGMMAGVFSPVGRLASAAAFVLANGVASLQVGNPAQIVNGLYEVMASTLIYVILPQEAGSRLIGMFSRTDDRRRADGLRRSVIMKLDYAAKALGNVSSSVEEVTKKLSGMSAPDINGVYKKAIDDVCCDCGLKAYCWERGYNNSMDTFNNLTEPLRKKGYITRTDFSPSFSSHCSRVGDIMEAINQQYSAFSMREAVEKRLAQVRAMVADQFSTASCMLEDMAGELELFERFDFAAAQRVTEVLRGADILPLDVSCRVDRFDRMSIEVEAAQFDRLRLNKAALTKEISRACGKSFEPPCISVARGKCRLQMSERPAFRVRSGCSQHVYGNGQLCGDSFTSFSDGCGRQIAILSDGMGSGGRAAVDGAMASGILSQLVQAGIGFDTALKIVNSALAAKGGDESSATIDLAAIDLFNGLVEFRKAGAPITIIRKNGKTSRMDLPSLPVGILNDVHFAKANEHLEDGDLLVMMSDGALAAGEEWFLEAVEQWKGTSPQELAEYLVAQAVTRRGDGHDDDVTVMAFCIEGRVQAAAQKAG